MIAPDFSEQTDFSYDFPWKSPIPKRKNFDRYLLWFIVVALACGSSVLGVYGAIELAPQRGSCGTCMEQIEAERISQSKLGE